MNINDDQDLLKLVRQSLVHNGDLPPVNQAEVQIFLSNMEKGGKSPNLSEEEAHVLVKKALSLSLKSKIIPFEAEVVEASENNSLALAARNGCELSQEIKAKMLKNLNDASISK